MNKRRRARVALTALALLAAAAGLLASTSGGATRTQRTIGLIAPGGADAFSQPVEAGGQAAAAALGDQLEITEAQFGDAATEINTIDSLIKQHASAIAVDTEDPTSAKEVRPYLAKARAAGIPTLSFEVSDPGSVWVNESGATQFGQALAQSLASQTKARGQFVIVSCRPSEAIVHSWLRAAKSYIGRHYPRMHRAAVVYGDLGNGTVDTHMLRRLTRQHPHLRGLIFLCPAESYIVPKQLIRAHKVGKIFAAGNGGACPPVDDPYRTYVRVRAEELVCAGDPAKLGYLTIWAANYLARGNTFTPGLYPVGGPVGIVNYFSANDELRLGPPITITQANLTQYTG